MFIYSWLLSLLPTDQYTAFAMRTHTACRGRSIVHVVQRGWVSPVSIHQALVDDFLVLWLQRYEKGLAVQCTIVQQESHVHAHVILAHCL